MKKQKPIPNTACLVAACRELGIPYAIHDRNQNLVSIGRKHFFANGSTPLNDEAVGKICKDKEFMYRTARYAVRMPCTLGFVDPDCNPEYQKYVVLKTHTKILHEIEKTFRYPIMLKMNSGSRGTNVYKCANHSSAAKALENIFDKRSLNYDYVAIAQEYIHIQKEFRVIILKGKIILIYEKETSNAIYTGNISPLHHENSKAVLITDDRLTQRIQQFICPLFQKIPIQFAGLDIAIDNRNRLWLIEVNTKPGFEYFVRDNGTSHLIRVYKEILYSLGYKKSSSAKFKKLPLTSSKTTASRAPYSP